MGNGKRSTTNHKRQTTNDKPQTTNINSEVLHLGKILWDYHHVNHIVQQSDCILALGSHDLRVADRAAELYLQGYAPMLIFSGGLGNLTREMWTRSEADLFA